VTLLARTDTAQAPIVKALRAAGRPVWSTHSIGKGFPDILTRHIDGHLILGEVKTGKGYTKPATRARQAAFAALFPVVRMTTPEEALRAVGLLGDPQVTG